MSTRPDAQTIEVFHLLFLRALTVNASNWFVLKGGANLRYFFNDPIRLREEVKIDVV